MSRRLDDLIIDKLNDEGVFDYFNIYTSLPAIDNDLINKLSNHPFKLELKDDDLYFIDKNGNLIKMSNHELGVFKCSVWLSDRIPSPPFNMDQGGNLRKALEAEFLYCCILISAILGFSYFQEELDEVKNKKGYNYDSMVNPSTNETFKNLLESWQAEQSFIINN